MYQCFVRNEYEMAQGIAELRLGGESLFAYRFHVHAADREDEGKKENGLKNRSFRFVSRSDFVRKGDIFEITRLILARNRLFPRGEKEGARPTSL